MLDSFEDFKKSRLKEKVITLSDGEQIKITKMPAGGFLELMEARKNKENEVQQALIAIRWAVPLFEGQTSEDILKVIDIEEAINISTQIVEFTGTEDAEKNSASTLKQGSNTR